MGTLLAGTYNSRDTGGMPLVTGGVTRRGVLYRSDGLSALTDEGLQQLAESPIGTIVDLRTPEEREQAPDLLPASRLMHTVVLPVLEGQLAGRSESDKIVDEEASGVAAAAALAKVPTVAGLYVSMLAHAAASFATVARLIARPQDAEHPAVLVHCTAGKDRTGVATALMLDAAGVEREAIIADYVATQANLAGEWSQRMLARIEASGAPLVPAIVDLVTTSPRAAVEAVLAWVDDHGGSAAYLHGGGLSDEDLALLRERFAG